MYKTYTAPPPASEVATGSSTAASSSRTTTPAEPAPTDGAALVDADKFPGTTDPFRPDVTDIATDVPLIYEGDCHVDQKSSTPQACTVAQGKKGAPTVALIGDSHAAQWSDALRIVASEQGWNAMSFT